MAKVFSDRDEQSTADVRELTGKLRGTFRLPLLDADNGQIRLPEELVLQYSAESAYVSQYLMNMLVDMAVVSELGLLWPESILEEAGLTWH